ncbi:MAG: cytochrome c biogenesis protein CcdA [Nanoarchaeota archaeon]|nr:cytochrome c biogenesis protein CcdA [Nanoarchaeota archaeon]
MKKIIIFTLVLLVLLSSVFASDVDTCGPDTESEICEVDNSGFDIYSALTRGLEAELTHGYEDSLCVIYFYGDGCSQCAKIKPFIDNLENKYGDKIHLNRFELYNNLKNYQLYTNYCSIQNIPLKDRGIPFVAIDDKFFMGSEQIIDNLEDEIDSLLESGVKTCPLPDAMSCHQVDDYNKSTVDTAILGLDNDKITLPLIIGAGLIDGVNPCAFAVLIFLLTFLIEVSSTKKRMVKAGIAYVAAVYVTYFVAGLGLLSVIQVTGLSRIILIVAAIVAIVAGLINVKDYFWYGKGFSLKISGSRKGIIEKWTKRANIPAALVLGFLVSMFELPCTGGVYLAILALLANTGTRISAVPHLLLYNLMFILPLVVIILAVTFGMKAEHIENWRQKRKNVMKLVMGLVLLALGFALLFGWF